MRGGGSGELTSRTCELKYPRMAVTSPLVMPLFLKPSKPLRVVGSSSSPSCVQKNEKTSETTLYGRYVSITVNYEDKSVFGGGVPQERSAYFAPAHPFNMRTEGYTPGYILCRFRFHQGVSRVQLHGVAGRAKQKT